MRKFSAWFFLLTLTLLFSGNILAAEPMPPLPKVTVSAETPAVPESGKPLGAEDVVLPAEPLVENRMVLLTGAIKDAAGLPLAGVRVALNRPPFAAGNTDEHGRFEISFSVPLGQIGGYAAEISKEGYYPQFVMLQERAAKSATESEAAIILSTLPPGSPPPEPTAAKINAEGIIIDADTLIYDQALDTYYAKGNVTVTSKEGVLSAAALTVNRKTNKARAEGHAVLQSGNDVVEGESMVMDIEKMTGVVDAGSIYMSQTRLSVTGSRLEKRAEATYFVENAKLTTCSGENPDWSMTGKSMDVTVEGYGVIKSGAFYANKVPILYFPYMILPAKTKRQSGLLFPRMAYSEKKLGWDIEVPYYWAISDNADATFYQRNMSKRGYQQGMELRYARDRDTYGTFYADYLNDGMRISEAVGNISRNWQENHNRWAIYWNHQAKIDKTFSVRADIARVSDNFYFRDFSSSNYFLNNYNYNRVEPFKKIAFMGNEGLSTLDSTVRLVKTWDRYNLTGLVKSSDNLTINNNDGTLQKYPEIILTGMKQPLYSGGKVLQEFTATYDYFYRGAGQKGHYLDLNPILSRPMSYGPYFQVTPTVGIRATSWMRDDSTNDGMSKQGVREVYSTGLTMTSEVSRVFTTTIKGFEKVRHGIRPEASYAFSRYANQNSLPDFASAVSDQNIFTYGVLNTLVARTVEKGKKRYIEFLRFKLGQSYDVNESNKVITDNTTTRRPLSDVIMDLDVRPTSRITFLARNRYNPYDLTWTQANYDLSFTSQSGHSAVLAYRYSRNVLEETNFRIVAAVDKKLSLLFGLRRDHFNQRDVEKLVGFNYKTSCWMVGVDVGERNNDTVYAIRYSLFGM